jgi:hypothetical protein
MNLSDIYLVFYQPATEYTFFSATHGTFSKIDNISEHKATLNKRKKIEIPSCILSDHSGIKLYMKNKLQKIFKHMETEQYHVE